MKRDLFIIGWSSLVKDFYEVWLRGLVRQVELRGVVLNGSSPANRTEIENRISLLDDISLLLPLVEHSKNFSHLVLVIALGEKRSAEFLRMISWCVAQGCEVREMVDLYEEVMGKVPVQHVQESWLLSVFNRPRMGYRFLKRAMDIVLSATFLVVLSPLFFLIAVLIGVTSGRPIFYQQCRVGKGEREFIIYKFRTMVEDAEKNEAVWAIKNDPRVTSVGRFLRRFRLDEMPQLVNVLKGEMSLIGPRPERPEFVQKLQEEIPFYNYRHVVKPGITGWAQVKYPYACSVEDSLQKLQYDLFGVRNASLMKDISILSQTVRVVLSGAGAH